MADIDIKITQELLLLIAEIDEFKGKWRALNTLAPDSPLEQLSRRKRRLKDERNFSGTLTKDYPREVF